MSESIHEIFVPLHKPEKNTMIHIRKAVLADIDSIMRCYDIARQTMRASGNLNQWTNGYPSRQHVARDIADGISYVGVDEDESIVMVFAFFIGDDPTYAVIENGAWLNNHKYGTIHRLASDTRHHGILRLCVDFCSTMIDKIRLDTHADNHIMQHAAEKLGFKPCGIIYCQDGTPRIAYQRYLGR